MKLKILFLFPVVALVSACASMTNPKIDHPAVARSKKVAIVGFHLAMEEPKSMLGDVKKLMDATKGNFHPPNEEHATADEVYAGLSSKLEREMNWDVTPKATIAANGEYRELVKTFTTGLQIGGTPLPDNFHKIRPHGILDADPFIGRIDQIQREDLMNKLHVDALVVDFLTVSLKNESTFGGMIGRAKYRPNAQNVIRVFVRGRKNPVWFDTWAWGEGDKALQAEMNFVEDKPLLEQVVLASQKSFGETVSRFRKF